MENALLALPLLMLGFRRLRLSNGSYAALFVFLLSHEIGAHYTYSKVPWDRWLAALLGFSPSDALGVTRNHFDRAIHFAYGLLVIPAVAGRRRRAFISPARASPRPSPSSPTTFRRRCLRCFCGRPWCFRRLPELDTGRFPTADASVPECGGGTSHAACGNVLHRIHARRCRYLR
jgi:hypothetical protein